MDDRDATIVRLLASGIVRYADRVRAGQPLPLPYPASLRRAFDRMSLECMAAGLPPPGSVMALLRKAQQPFGSDAWPIRLMLPDVGEHEVLLAHGAPTQALILDTLDLGLMESEYLREELLANHPLLSLVEVNGLLVDVRTLPEPLQALIRDLRNLSREADARRGVEAGQGADGRLWLGPWVVQT